MKQAIRVNDDDQDDDGGMDVIGYLMTFLIVLGLSMVIAAMLWLPEIARRFGWTP